MDIKEVSRIRVAFLIRSFYYGGAERQLLNLIKGMDKSRFEPIVICYYAAGELLEDFTNSGMQIISLHKKGRWDILFFFYRLVKLLEYLRPDILYSFLTMSNVLAGLVRSFTGKPLVVFGIRYAYIDFSDYDWMTRIIYWLETRLSPLATLTIVNSNAGKENQIKKGYIRERIVVIPNGIDTATFYLSQNERREFREGIGIEVNTLLVGLVGRLDPVKDHPCFLQAAASIINKREDVRFVCVGDGETQYLKELQSLARTLGIVEKVIWLEGQKNVRAVYNSLDIFCSASIGESFSNVIAEAMACCVPCVVTDVGDSAIIVGEFGVVVPAGDAIAMAEGLNQVISLSASDRLLLGENSRRRIEENFSKERMIQRTEQTLINLKKGIIEE